MMIASRILACVVILSNCAVLSMESWQRKRQVDIDIILEAVNFNDVEYVERYIADGGDINLKGTIPANAYSKAIKRMTPLMTAAFYGRPKLMKIFIGNGAKLNCTNEHGDTALIMTARLHYSSLARLLVKAGANKNIHNKEGKTALEEAQGSLMRRFYRDYSGKYGKNHSFAELTKLLTDKEDGIMPSVHIKSKRKVAKNKHVRTVPSLQYTCDAMQYYRPMITTGYHPVLYIQQY
jgi:hypothetical protein